jgi:membrane protein YdbS with pleckstrin-like domain
MSETSEQRPVDPASELTGEGSSHDERAEMLDPSQEKDLWHGRESWKAAYPPLALVILATIAAAVASKLIWPATWYPVGWVLLAGLLVAVFVLFRGGWKVASSSYRITTQRLFIRRGVLSQSVDQTELLRVDDVKMRQSLLQRVLNIGDIEVISSDRTDAHIKITNVADPAQVTEYIRRHTRMLQRRTLFMEQL